jgi:hypothetical protein
MNLLELQVLAAVSCMRDGQPSSITLQSPIHAPSVESFQAAGSGSPQAARTSVPAPVSTQSISALSRR